MLVPRSSLCPGHFRLHQLAWCLAQCKHSPCAFFSDHSGEDPLPGLTGLSSRHCGPDYSERAGAVGGAAGRAPGPAQSSLPPYPVTQQSAQRPRKRNARTPRMESLVQRRRTLPVWRPQVRTAAWDWLWKRTAVQSEFRRADRSFGKQGERTAAVTEPLGKQAGHARYQAGQGTRLGHCRRDWTQTLRTPAAWPTPPEPCSWWPL